MDQQAERAGRRIPALVWTLPALLVAAGVVYEVLTPDAFTAIPFFTAAPLVAVSLYPLSGTIATGAAATLATIAVHLRSGTHISADDMTEEFTVAIVAVLAVALNRVVHQGDQRLATQRQIAEAAQRAVLPEPEERIGGFDVAVRYEAAQKDASIGGDLYAVQDTPHGVRLLVGDVRGKGMGAVAVVAVLIGAFREAAEREDTLCAVAQRLERALAREVARRAGPDADEGFTTAVLAELPHDEPVVRLVNCGHPAPLLLCPDGEVRPLPAVDAALPLGMADLGVNPGPVETVTSFPAGATLLVHTDGLSEARDAHGAFYDPVSWLQGRAFDAPAELLAALAAQVRLHTGGGTTDDMALLAVRRL